MKVVDEYNEYMRIYRKKFGERTVVLYQCGSFYELYSDSLSDLWGLREIANILGINVTKKNKKKEDSPLMAGRPKLHGTTKFINILMKNKYQVVIVDQEKDGISEPNRSVTEIVSPSLALDYQESFDSSNLMSIFLEEYFCSNKKKNFIWFSSNDRCIYRR